MDGLRDALRRYGAQPGGTRLGGTGTHGGRAGKPGARKRRARGAPPPDHPGRLGCHRRGSHRLDRPRRTGPAEPRAAVRFFESLAAWVVRFRLLVIACWLVALVA